MKTRYFAILTALAVFGFSVPAAAHPCSRHNNPSHKHCADEGPQTTYTVELMGRVFHFAPPVTAKDEGALVPDPAAPLTFSRPGVGGAVCIVGSPDDTVQAICAWDAVFAACENFFGPNTIIGPTPIVVTEFTVPADNWNIQKPGGVRLQMSIPFDENGNSPPIGPEHLQVSLQLIGDTFFDSPNAPWLPDPGDTIDYNIVDFWITGRTVKGVRPKKGCVSGGSAEQTDFDPGQVRTIKIEAFAAP